MPIYHITNKGEVYPCRARDGRCPFGGESGKENHFESAYEARLHYEKNNKSFDVVNTLRKVAPKDANFNTVGLTKNVNAFKGDLFNIKYAIENYEGYRSTGLKRDAYIPETPKEFANYINSPALNLAWRNQKFDEVREIYKTAIKSYYREKVFQPEDVDCLLDDDEIDEILGKESPY